MHKLRRQLPAMMLQVGSYGVGAHVKLPGASQKEPNVYNFGVATYRSIYEVGWMGCPFPGCMGRAWDAWGPLGSFMGYRCDRLTRVHGAGPRCKGCEERNRCVRSEWSASKLQEEHGSERGAGKVPRVHVRPVVGRRLVWTDFPCYCHEI